MSRLAAAVLASPDGATDVLYQQAVLAKGVSYLTGGVESDCACSEMPRCAWASIEPNITYHDREWGVPVHDDRKLFEFLILEGAQAGLSWTTILKKRDNYRKAFDGFRAEKIARYDAG